MVPGRPGRRPGQPRARALPLPREPRGRRRAPRPTTGARSSGVPRGPRSRTASGTSTSSTPPSPTSNWRNPEVGDMFVDVLSFWLDRGVDGFRVDVAHGLFKEEGLRDQVVDEGELPSSDSSEVTGGSSMVERTHARRADVGPARGARGLPPLARRAGEVRRRTGCSSPRRGPRSSESMARFIRPDEMSQAFNFSWLLARLVGRAPSRRSSPAPSPRSGSVGATADLGAQQPRRRPARHPLRRRRAGPGPRPRGHADDARRCPARRTSTRARSSASSRSTCPPSFRQDPSWFRTGERRPRRLPGADPVGRRRRAVRLRPGRPASRGSRSPTTGRTLTVAAQGDDPGLDAGVLPRRPARAPRATPATPARRSRCSTSAPTCWRSAAAR